ncbi:MAG: hypothetical protein Q7S51_08145 [Gallionellaceae bacterium]|nr:hypothetical protein [Gallionellaceae bacterium]
MKQCNGTHGATTYRAFAGRHVFGTGDDVQGLVAQGRTIAETIEIARDVAKKLN